jgi:hypothetical protein
MYKNKEHGRSKTGTRSASLFRIASPRPRASAFSSPAFDHFVIGDLVIPLSFVPLKFVIPAQKPRHFNVSDETPRHSNDFSATPLNPPPFKHFSRTLFIEERAE